MSRNVDLAWEWPTEREDGEALKEGDISHAHLEIKLEQAPDTEWLTIGNPPFPETEFPIRDLASGDWLFRGTVVGTRDGDVSDPVIVGIGLEPARIGGLSGFRAEEQET